MNKRIRELIEQATKVVEPNDPDYRDEFFDKEKFAKLIVQECVYIPIDMWSFQEIDAESAAKVSRRIKDRFGVE